MADVVAGAPCLMFALRRESMYFRRECPTLTPVPFAPCAAWNCVGPFGPLLVLETGVGRAAVDAVLDWLLPRAAKPAFVLYAGFAGALDATLCVGDVLLADEIVDETGQTWPATWPADAKRVPPSLRRGRLLTTACLVASAGEKHNLKARHHAVAADMEAAFVAVRCAGQRVPFGCVRAISDTVDTPLSPELVALLAGGRISLPRVLAAVAHKPTLLSEFWRLARDTRRAARRLGQALGDLLRAS